MAKLRGLTLRGKTYYSRIIVPTALVSRFGRDQIWKSLRTSNRSDAEALHLQQAAEWSAAFAEAEREAAGAERTIQAQRVVERPDFALSDAARLARQFFDRQRTELDLRTRSPAEYELAEKESAESDIQWELSALNSWASPDAHRLVAEAEKTIIKRHRDPSQGGSPESEVLAELLRRALLQLGALELARLNGDFRDQVTDAFFQTPHHADARQVSRASTVTVGECIDRYLGEALAIRSVTAKTSLKHQALLNHIGAYFGRREPIHEIVRADCNAYRDHLAKLPPNAGKGSQRRVGEKRGPLIVPVLSWETQNNYLRMLSDLMGWAVREQLIGINPAEQIKPLRKREAAEDQRQPFNVEELRIIFSAPLFTGSRDDERGFALPGPNVTRRSRYWLPLIALFSGMRMGEILQLTPQHVRTSAQGTRFFVLTRDMRLKTGAAEREVPVHPELIRLGFLDWVNTRPPDEQASSMFPEVSGGKHGYASDIFTKRFATFLRSCELPADRIGKLCFHSFRHSWKDALNETGASEEIKDEICGWSRSKKTGRRYGTGLSADLMRAAVEQVKFGVDLSSLPPFVPDEALA